MSLSKNVFWKYRLYVQAGKNQDAHGFIKGISLGVMTS